MSSVHLLLLLLLLLDLSLWVELLASLLSVASGE